MSLTISSLQFVGARFSYEDQAPIFSDLSMSISTGKNVFVTGPHGSGQSTFLKLVGVLLQPQKGQYLINGQDTSQMSFEEFLPYRHLIGYTFDYGGLFANRTVLQNLTLPLLYHKLKSFEEAEHDVRTLASKFKFGNQLDQRPAAVSGGLRKLACVLRAFMMNPEMMVMDDPFTGVGNENAEKLIDFMVQKRTSGRLKHVFMSSRESTWPAILGCETLWLENQTSDYNQNNNPGHNVGTAA